MKKLIEGIIKFRKEVSQTQLEHFAKLALEQNPDTLFIACSDSRVVPNLFASTDPGDLFVVRNVGNIIPPAKDNGFSSSDISEMAAVEFSVQHLNVKDIIVCGHSECGAMHSLLTNDCLHSHQHLSEWIKHAAPSKNILKQERNKFSNELSEVNVLSQLNVLQQVKHLKTYPIVNDKIDKGELGVHAWWFDIATATVYSYDEDKESFEILE